MTLIRFIYSIIITIMVLFSIQVPTQWLYLVFLAFGALGIISNYSARLFLYLNISYALFIVFYAPLTSLSASLFPQLQPKIISIFIITLVLSLLGRPFLYAKRVDSFEGKWLNLILLAALIILYFQINKILAYSPFALFLVIATISYAILNITPAYAIYDYKKNHIVIALLIFVLLPFLNFIQFDNSKKTIGFIRYHSVWAKEDVPYNLDDWTLKSNYSYSEFSKLLSNKYKMLNIDSEKDLIENLQFCDAIIIMTPTVPFTSSEKINLKKYLDLNGKIIIIGDHTDLYGHGRVINDLIENTGVSINYDAHFSPDNWYGEVPFRNTIFGNVRPLTASSISVNKPVYVMAWSHNWISEAANYNAPNFFGDLTWTDDDKLGDFPLAVTAKVGAGHITLWTDSTMFSNFALYQPRVLQTIEHLITNGEFLSSVTHYYSFLIFILLALSIVVFKYRGTFIIFIFFISSLTGGLYLIHHVKTDGYYNPQSRIDIFCNEDIIRESPPNKDILPFTLSNLYSNIARYDLQPKWISDNPSECLTKQACVWLTTYDNFLKWTGHKPKYVVITDDSKNISRLGYKKVFVNTESTHLGIGEGSNRQFWGTSDSKHSITLDGTSIFASYGVLDDHTIGNWWATIEVSLYRKEMITRFVDWIKEKRDINLFQYPKLGVIAGKRSAVLMQHGKENRSLNNIDFYVLEFGKNKYIYLGGEMWGLLNKENQSYFILGGPETSDNYLKYKNTRFLISINTKEKKKDSDR